MKRKYGFHDPLNKGDTEKSTVGCRAFNPDICSDCDSQYCALSNQDGICRRPRKSWAKQYKKLLGEK